MPLSQGQVLNNRYRIDKLIGQGGFGAVYLAWDNNLGTQVAIKESLDSSPDALKQFKIEAKILYQLAHHNLPRVHDYFALPGQGTYLVMDSVEGEDSDILLNNNGGPLPETKVLDWADQICDALIYLHSQNPPIVHRDIKPGNIRISPDGKAWLLDFGVAKVSTPNTKTTVGARAVTPGYSPIEQYGHGTTDARTDVYSLGATLYALLTDCEPQESVQRTIIDSLIPPEKHNPILTQKTINALKRALQIDPNKRFQNAKDFKESLSPLSIPASSHSVTSSFSSWASQPVSPSSSRLLTVLIGAVSIVLLVVLSTGFFLVFQSNAKMNSIAEITTNAEATKHNKGKLTLTAGSSTREKSNPPVTETHPAITSPYTATPSRLPSNVPLSTSVTSSDNTWVRPADNMVMIFIPAGEFLMGSPENDTDALPSEKPQHLVYLDGYWVDETEVTNKMFGMFIQATNYQTTAEKKGTGWVYFPLIKKWQETPGANWRNPRGPTSNLTGRDDYPVVQVSWEDAQEYCTWVGGRLPTEAEWEKAARGTDGRIFPWGNQQPNCNLANFWGTTNGCIGDISLVGNYQGGASPYGVMDMAGNVSEWVHDWFSEVYYSSSPANNPTGPASGQYRVLRGGSWANSVGIPRAAMRDRLTPDNRNIDFGFRCARSSN